MKTVTVRNLQQHIRENVEAAQNEKVVITRKGKPSAILIGVEGQDWETVLLQTSARFWKLIEKRRAEKSVSLKDMKLRFKKTKAR